MNSFNSFLPFLIASLITAGVWTILAIRFDRHNLRFMGLIGAWVATVILAALWQVEAVPWVANFITMVLLAWLGAIALLFIAIVLTWVAKEPGRGPLLCCAGLSFVVNLAAGLVFLWLATVSPGGV
jgi:cytochrome bd-type quinol oxidase subunit 1